VAGLGAGAVALTGVKLTMVLACFMATTRSIKPLPPLRELEKWFAIDGSDLVWRTSYFKELIGKRAGYMRPDGYVEIRKQNNKMLAHRIAYYIATRENPGNYFIDHIDGNPSNNCPSNLRMATATENLRNCRRLRRNNTSGQSGVTYAVVGGIEYWKAYVVVKGRQLHLGSYATKEAAIAAREVAEKFTYGKFAPIALDPEEVFCLFAEDKNFDRSHPV
jgi:hypothetical protein